MVRTLRTAKFLAMALLVGMVMGCEDKDKNSGIPVTTNTPTGSDPTAPGTGGTVSGTELTASSQLGLVEQSIVATDAIGLTIQLTSDAVADSGSGGVTRSARSARSSGRSAKGLQIDSQIDFQPSVTLTINLDDTGPLGNDLHPNATGVVTVQANGSVIGNEFAGTVAYDVSVHFDTDVTFTDPDTAERATIAAGSSLSYSLVIEWDKTDNQNVWLKIDAEAAITGLNITVTKGEETATVTLEAERHVVGEVRLQDGVLTLTARADGFWDLTISSAEESHAVRLDIVSVSEAYITIDGQKYGPYNAFELDEQFGIDVFEIEDPDEGLF